MVQRKDISGSIFGRLTAISIDGRDKFGIALWNCRCICGNSIVVRLCSLTSGSTKSCGCLNKESRILANTGNTKAKTHGLSKHYLYQTWSTMKQRCTNINHAKYYLYGARGIRVCDSWIHSFEQFLKDMGDRPKGFTLNRIDNNGDYCPENCEWQSYSIQNSNRRKYKRKATGLFNEIG